jgi:hypothetical protein
MGIFDADNRSNLIKGGLAGAVILACVIWVAVTSFGNGPVVIKPNAAAPVAAWMQAYQAKQTELYQLTEKIAVRASDDGSGVVVSGSVKNAADLAAVKAALEAIQPKAPLTWDVKVGQ